MELPEKIEKQIIAGFSKEEIYSSLMSEGYSRQEIDGELSRTSHTLQSRGKVSGKSIVLGVIMLLVVLYRFLRLMDAESNTAMTFGIISAVTGLGVAFFFFTRKG